MHHIDLWSKFDFLLFRFDFQKKALHLNFKQSPAMLLMPVSRDKMKPSSKSVCDRQTHAEG